MNRLLIVLFAVIGNLSYAQNCNDCRYLTEIFDSVTVTESIKFAEGENSEGNTQELFLDVYEPYGDTLQNRPVLLFAFGGAFVTGTRQERYVKLACDRYAKAGYTAIAMDYRIGIDIVGGLSNPGDEAMKVFFRPMQDLRASIEFVYHSAKNGNEYQVDTNLIFLGGASAGAISALFTEYCDHPDKMAEIGDTTELSSYGGFYASSSIFPRQSRKIAAVINVAGAMTNADWVEAGKAPHISAHGDEDGTVPYEDDNQLNSGLGLLGITLEGSYLINQRANDVGLCSYLYTIEGGDHPSGGASQEYYDAIFNRWMPRMHAIIQGRTYCCQGNPDLEIIGDSLISNDGDTVDFEMEESYFNNPSYKWCSLPCNTNNDQKSVQSATNIGDYFIAITYDSSCQLTDFVTIKEKEEDSTGIARIQNITDIKLFPNPVSNQLLLEIDEPIESIRIFDTKGQLLLSEQTNFISRPKVDVQELANGAYIILLEGKEKLYRGTFIKE